MTSLRVSTSEIFNRPASQMASLTRQSTLLQTQISTGKQFTKASENVVGWTQVQTLDRADANGTADASNIKMAQSLLTQSDSVLDSIQTQLQQAQELATNAASGTLNDTDRAAIAQQIDSILTDVLALANTKDVRGGPLFGGATGDTAYTQAADGTVSFAGSGTPASIPIGDGVSIQATESGDQIFGNVATAGGTSDVFAMLGELSAALKAGGSAAQDAASNAIDDLGAALDQIGTTRASLGARNARLDLESSRLTDAAEARDETRTAVQGTDTTKAVADLQQTLTILSATQASFTKLTSLSLFDYLK